MNPFKTGSFYDPLSTSSYHGTRELILDWLSISLASTTRALIPDDKFANDLYRTVIENIKSSFGMKKKKNHNELEEKRIIL